MKIKQLILATILLAGTFSANAQISSGDLYQGMSRSIPNGRVVLPYGLDVTYEKTLHLIFPLKSVTWIWEVATSSPAKPRMPTTYFG